MLDMIGYFTLDSGADTHCVVDRLLFLLCSRGFHSLDLELNI